MSRAVRNQKLADHPEPERLSLDERKRRWAGPQNIILQAPETKCARFYPGLSGRKYMRLDEVAKRWSRSVKHVRRLIDTGCLIAVDFRTPGSKRPSIGITWQSVVEFEEKHPVE